MIKLNHYLLLLLLYSTSGVAQVTLPEDRAYDTVELDYVVAEVNEGVILRTELDNFLNTIKAQLREKSTKLPPKHILEKQALDRLIINQLQLQLAHKTGIRVNDEALNTALIRIAAQNNLKLNQLRQRLESDGMDFSEFREEIRNEIIITKLQQRQVINRIRVSKREIERFLERQKVSGNDSQLYRVGHILIALPEAATTEEIQSLKQKANNVHQKLMDGEDFSQTAIAVSKGQKAFEGGDMGWLSPRQLPSMFADVLVDMKRDQISDILTSASGFHIIKLLDLKSDKKHVVKQTSARHILIKTSEITSKEDILTRLTQLKTRIEGGEDFATLARAHSDDTLSAQRGGELGWTSPGELVPQFEQTMNALQIGQISEPVRTQFGWHIIEVLGHRAQDNTEKFMQSKALESIRKRKAQEALEIWSRQLRDEAYVKYNLQQ